MPGQVETFTWVGAGGTTSTAIRDTNTDNSDEFHKVPRHRYTFQAVSSLDQTVTITFQGSLDKVTWTSMPNPIAVTAGSSNYATLSDPWAWVRASAVCSVGPSSGELAIYALGRFVEA